MSSTMGPGESVLAATVARRHFLTGQSKTEIAEELGLNRFKVARLIDAAREEGLIKIEIASPGRVDLDLSSQVKEALSLKHCAVVSSHDAEDQDGLEARGRVAADLLAEIMADDDVLGLPWSRSVLSMSEHLHSLPRVGVVQLSGAMEVDGIDSSAVDIVRTAARASDGAATIFHAPFVLDDRQAAAAIRRQPSVDQGMSAIQKVTHAVVGVGSWISRSSSIFDWASAEDRAEAHREGVIGETAGVFFDSAGRPIHLSLSDRMITLSGADLMAIPQVIASAGGAERCAVLRAAVTGGLVKSAVIDTALAQAILNVTSGGTTRPDASAAS